MTVRDQTLGELVDLVRAHGPNKDLERILQRKWYCPHCREQTDLMHVAFVKGDPEIYHSKCDKFGAKPVVGDAADELRKLLKVVAKFDTPISDARH